MAEMEIFAPGKKPVGPVLTPELEASAQDRLGFKLPESLLRVLRVQNGGTLLRQCFPTTFESSWAADHIAVDSLLSVGGTRGIDSALGSAYRIAEWQYPEVGVVLCDTPSGGHDAVMLDYRESGPNGEPAVVFVDEDRLPQRLCGSVEEFFAGLVDCRVFTGSFEV